MEALPTIPATQSDDFDYGLHQGGECRAPGHLQEPTNARGPEKFAALWLSEAGLQQVEL